MKRYWTLFLVLFVGFSGLAYAAKPQPNPPANAPEIYSVKIDYSTLMILVEGINLDAADATATLGGANATLNPGSTDNLLLLETTADVATAVDGPGNYVLALTTGAGSINLSIFIPFGLVYLPPGEGPCPCEGDWDHFAGLASPAGYNGQEPYCIIDSGVSDYVTVQFWDTEVGNYWVLRTQWTGSTGFCEQYLDGPRRELSSEDEYNACAAYLRTNYVDVYPSPIGGTDCLF